MSYDVEEIRRRFPILSRKIEGKPLIYLDNTATSQTPRSVVDAIVAGYDDFKANVHRGVHTLSQEATELQEECRRRVRGYIGASSEEEVIFTRGTTEAINLVASSFGSLFPKDGEIILTVMEHHANIVPWQLLQSRRPDLKIRVVDIDDRGELLLDQYRSLFNEHTCMASFCHVSNVLGTVNPVREMIGFAHSRGVPVLVDGAQAVPHMKVDVNELDCDFYVFSSHKMYGPTGVGVLYGKKEHLLRMPPYQGGGEMIAHVSFEGTTFADLPFKFEAGTPDFVGIGAFPKALDFIEEIGMDAMAAHEKGLMEYAEEKMREIPGMRIFGNAPHKSAVISFLVGDIHHYDMGMLLDKLGVEVRTGHHCAQPLMQRLGISGTVRASFAAYNTREEVDAFIAALRRVIPILS
ncbi:MAG: SufS family cysteine desulfurase [Muribaculaceae bacterium]|nr:SufS family cysteine desulfurase [Muribaculaceae bacterium]